MFFDPNEFEFVRTLEANWRTIKEELDILVPGEFADWPERELYGQGWSVFGLWAFGKPFPANCARCPRTAELLKSIPGMSMAGFSALAPGTKIRPHRGYTSEVLRCHLGLVTVPEAGIRVGSEIRSWEPGKCIVFDDSQEHEAWNQGSRARIVLLIDFAKVVGADPYVGNVPAEIRAAVEALSNSGQRPQREDRQEFSHHILPPSEADPRTEEKTTPEVVHRSQRFLVREASEPDLPFIRAWLPEALGGTPSARIVMATDAATGNFAGCAALRAFVDRVGRFLIYVAPTFRRQGCGTILLDYIRTAAQRANLERLLTGRCYPPETADAESLAALGFIQARGMAVGEDLIRYRADMKAALAVLEPLYLRLARDPAHFGRTQIVTADQVDRRALAEFAVQHLGGYPEDVAERLSGRGQAYLLPTSMVALQSNRIVGAFLTVPLTSDIGLIERRAVNQEHRGSWINLGMMYLSAAAGTRLGFTTLEFEGNAQDRDTSKLARRLGAIPVGRRQGWGCPLAGGDESQSVSRVKVEDEGPTSSGDGCTGWHAEALLDERTDGLKLAQLQDRLFFASANDVIQLLTERSVGSLSLTSKFRQVSLHLKLERHGPEVFDRQSGLRNCLLFLALPRSASLYIVDTLAAGLGLDKVTIDNQRFPHDLINPQTVSRLAVPGTICHCHADPRLGNLASINRLIDRLVVHVRDPRQSMLSAIHHLNDLRVRLGSNRVARLPFPLPSNFFSLGLAEQIDWMLSNGLALFVRWIEGWLNASANPLFRPRVFLTRYEDLHADPKAYFDRLLGFYETAWRVPDFRLPPAQSHQHYRKGMTDEWRTVFTPRQRQAASALVPARLRERFDWAP